MIENSKNIVSAEIHAGGHIIVGDGSTIINLKESVAYRNILRTIEELDSGLVKTLDRISRYPEDEGFRQDLIEISKKKHQAQEELWALKRELNTLVDLVNQLPEQTGELADTVRQLIRGGRFDEAKTLLHSERLNNELEQLLLDKTHLESREENNKRLLSQKAMEYMLLAGLTAASADDPDRSEKATAYYERSLLAERNVYNLFSYAFFLQKRHDFDQAIELYREIIQLPPGDDASQEQLSRIQAKTLTNLGIMYSIQDDPSAASDAFDEALQRYNSLTDIAGHELERAGILVNLGVFRTDQGQYAEARCLLDEAERIYGSAQYTDHPDLPADKAFLFNCSGNLFFLEAKTEEAELAYGRALGIRRGLAASDPQRFLPALAKTLHGIALPYMLQPGRTAEAQQALEEALAILRDLSLHDPRAGLPDLCYTAALASRFYREQMPDWQRSLALATEGIQAAFPFLEELPSLQSQVKNIFSVVESWGLDPDEFVEQVMEYR